MTVGGLLHDIGKAQVSTDILDKPGKLTDAEFAEIKKHPVIGYDYLRKQNLIAAETLAAVRHHHEYLDGSGYPDGLTAPQIGDLTRITTICDVDRKVIEMTLPGRMPESSCSPIMAANPDPGLTRTTMELVGGNREPAGHAAWPP